MNTRALLVRDLFGSALDLPATERPAFLREACGEDASLLSEVADLLATTPTDDFLEPPELSEVLPPRPPSTLGPYQIDQQLGTNLFLGRDPTTGRTARIELLLTSANHHDLGLMQFVRQAHGASHLASRVPVPVREHGHCGDQLWVAMEHVPGPSLAEELQLQDPSHPGPRVLPHCTDPAWLPNLATLTTQLATALGQAHRLGLAHGELSPTCILLEGPAQPRLLGFGFAALRGTMATAHDDIRALGSLVATMLALAPPSPGNALLDQLRQIAERSQRKGDHGYPSMHDLLLDLQPAAPSPPTAGRLRGWPKRRSPPAN